MMDINTIIAVSRGGADIDARELLEPETRTGIYALLHRNVSPLDRGLLRQLLLLEMQYRADESNPQDYFENLGWCGLLMYQIGDLDDVMLLWRAKHVTFDTACGFDIQFLVGGGVDATIKFLAMTRDSDAQDALSCIRECQEAGDFDNLSDWLAFRLAYYD